MLLRAVTLLVWALAAGSAVFWGLKVFAAPRPVPPGAGAPPAVQAGVGSLARVLGTVVVEEAPVEAAPVADSRFSLLGVVASRDGRGGVALIAVNGEPARPVRVGNAVDGDTVLLGVTKRRAELGPRGGEVRVALELPEPMAAAQGALPLARPGMPLRPGMPPMQPQILPPRPLPAPQAQQPPMQPGDGAVEAEGMAQDDEE